MWFLNIFVQRIRSFTNITSAHFIQIVTSRRSSDFSPLGTKLYFHVSSLRKIYIVLTFNKAAFSRGCKPRITSWLFNCWFNLTCCHATTGIPLGFVVFFVLGGLLTTPGQAERDNSPSQSSWSTLYMCFGGTSFQEQNWCVEFDSSCIIIISS